MNAEEVKRMARQYPQVIRWGDEDGCYVVSLPNIFGDCCYAATPQEVAAELAEIAEEWVQGLAEMGAELPAPRLWIDGDALKK